MVSNTYTPIVGGVERSIKSFTAEFKKLGHEVLILTLEFDGRPQSEEGVIRVPAIRRFKGSDFSVPLPTIPTKLYGILNQFRPDIVHAHHPFMLGDTALRIAKRYQVPLIFTYHTKYEDYTHYIPGPSDSPLLKRFVVELGSGYADLADQVFSPSGSMAQILRQRGVKTPIEVIPTGVDIENFGMGNRENFRREFEISQDSFVIGHVGRLAVEKNLMFLSEAVIKVLKRHPQAHFLVIGKGPLQDDIKKMFGDADLGQRVTFTGSFDGKILVDAYSAMDVFAFSSKTETQGLVMMEAMAASVPVVALAATGTQDVVKDQINGYLVKQENLQEFQAALERVMECSKEDYKKLQTQSCQTAEEFSTEKLAKRAIEIYEKLRRKDFVYLDIESSPWAATLNRIKAEWELVHNWAEAVATALTSDSREKNPLDVKPCKDPFFIRLRRWLSPWEWSAYLLGFRPSRKHFSQPGLVLIQIDGFPMKEIQTALKKGEMPFLRRLLSRERYELYPFYSGIPSSTPAVQAELFYGVKSAVPGFSFYDRPTQKVFQMYTVDHAIAIEERLQSQHGPGLLKGGSSYSNIYSGGAEESHFCSVNLGWNELWEMKHPFKMMVLTLIHCLSFLKTMVRIAFELVFSLIDFFNGVIIKKDFMKELKFIPTRLAICIVLRDFITWGAKIDIIRGLPIIHLNLLGYDEHAHRRGPSSAFAHRTLRGIDQAIANIYSQALYATRRNYDVWIYSDHGQEAVASYRVKQGQSVYDAVRSVLESHRKKSYVFMNWDVPGGVQSMRIQYFGKRWFNKAFPSATPIPTSKPEENNVIVAAMGPIGHIYLWPSPEPQEKDFLAQIFVKEANIPMILFPYEGQIVAWTSQGRFVLPEDAANVFGREHPYLKEVTEDMMRVCQNSLAGDLVICGWKTDGQPWSFPIEGGAHGGPGPNETSAFVMLPADILASFKEKFYLRPLDLRQAALDLMGRFSAPQENLSTTKIKITPMFAKEEGVEPKKTRHLRIMTYNVRSCMGLDGKISPERIARVIGRHRPDIVALQELDLNRSRTGSIDQPHLIARYLEMMYHFHPAIHIEEEKYGDAILTRFPMEIIQAQKLPGIYHPSGRLRGETRGAMWTTIDVGGVQVQVINTHLGLRRAERILQTKSLLGDEWLANARCQGPTILCGDFNALPYSSECRLIREVLKDAQMDVAEHRPCATWFGYYPVGRIDYIFVSNDIMVKKVEVSRAGMDKIASDHIPLIVDLEVPVIG
ncbi:MAG: glycosyltransferase [Candidatus Omnitrophica bacterium]|nr:glycosyltransferase [Candidatus Omnitrophota bacterium]